ncbi:ORC2-domain-containing protein [Massarina eburnea CBS 473.64]|uniref:Origin recognition complex subunit 2 n=1 Tax=Massarina eburnea CBS 473.64 TaxID=1395130 RepID=A0A6A6RXV8_9PLEO|nr:ORC2-domain-containing protein [Massarina eburnea CBS 473.64]
MASVKRKRHHDDAEDATPRKLRTRAAQEEEENDDDEEGSEEPDVQTPSRRQAPAVNATPRSILKKGGLFNGGNGATPKSTRKLVFETPSKAAKDGTTIVRNADRSARRKSNRRFIERTLNGDSDEEALDEEEALAEQILSDQEEAADDQEGGQPEAAVPDTPSKRGRGRPKGSGTGKKSKLRKERSPTPPQHLPPHEEYFYQNRPGGAKTSNNTLSAQSLLNHDEYFSTMQTYAERHEPEMEFLLELHSRAHDQWIFELEEGFNICLYGYGSKRPITEAFTAHLYKQLIGQEPYKGTKKTPRIVVINGYAPGTTLKDILVTIASACMPSSIKLPNQPTALLNFILDYLFDHEPAHPIPIILNSIDSPYLRKSPAAMLLAALAAHPSINLVCTADTPTFPLLWDVGLKAQYKFLFHDATTFAPYDAEIDVVESVNELLGRSGRRIGGRDGVGFVLRSLPENARALFRILVTEQLALLYMDDAGGEVDAPATPKNKKVATAKTSASESNQGVEYRTLYHKAVEEFVCSSEVGFRTLLKEFHDHQMIESRKDAMGTERLFVPFRQEELEGLAEDLSGDAL